MAPLLDGPRLPALSGKPRQLVVFLHGYGADGNDLVDLGRQWQSLMPDAAFVFPHAPEACGQSPGGRQWFALTFRDPDERWRGVVNARPTLEAFLDQELDRLGLDDRQLALVGFRQGTMMALHTGLRRARAPGAVIGYSGVLIGETNLAEATAHPPILLVHGDADQVIPLHALFQSADHLAKAGHPCEWHLSLGVGHGIDPGGLQHGGLFLARAFGVTIPAA